MLLIALVLILHKCQNVCCGVHSTDNSSYNELCKAMVIISRVACWLETSDVAYKCHQVA